MKKIIPVILIIIAILSGCEKDKINIDPDNYLIGTWVETGYQDDIRIFTRSPELNSNKPGYIFSDEGQLVERKNAGWCGTPPVTYADYNGSWTAINDTLIHVSVGYWGGIMDQKLDIQSVTGTVLKIKFVFEE